jgi:putative transposase
MKVFILLNPKHRRKVFYDDVRKFLYPMFHELANQKKCWIIEGHMSKDHVHICIEIPPKHAISSDSNVVLSNLIQRISFSVMARYRQNLKTCL